MKKWDFMLLCGAHNVDVSIALEAPEIVEALRDRDDERVAVLMDEIF